MKTYARMNFVGGELTVDWLLAAYERGIFPWPIRLSKRSPHVLTWFAPDPRAIIELDGLHVPKRLARRIRQGQFQYSTNAAFPEVIRVCAAPRKDGAETWLNRDMISTYIKLHEAGFAHSLEVWQGEQLEGGLYGVALGGYFGAESMFHWAYDASKAAVVFLVQHLQRQRFCLLDTQVWSPHIGQMGGIEIPRAEFQQRLGTALAKTDVAF